LTVSATAIAGKFFSSEFTIISASYCNAYADRAISPGMQLWMGDLSASMHARSDKLLRSGLDRSRRCTRRWTVARATGVGIIGRRSKRFADITSLRAGCGFSNLIRCETRSGILFNQSILSNHAISMVV